ncbi:MAG TPA: TonB-dependent receptor [Thermoanaerobaculia bacterium]|nr:TonB-dependent receptor [Thermoanaerobaculia bacterium]
MEHSSFLKGVATPLLFCLVIFLVMAGAALPVLSQTLPPGSIAGRVTTAEGDPVAGAEVLLAELRRRTTAGDDGSFRFDAVPPGEYVLEASSDRLGSSVLRVRVTAGATVEAPLVLDLLMHRDEIVVTASPDARSRYEIAQPTSVLGKEELARQLQPTLGETLSREPGVSSTSFGQGASRPVIRGLGGDRIRVLEGGLGTGDASTTSPDHAVGIDPLSAERIEVLRGPATLLYGSSAVGGVVNVIDGRIPEEVPAERITGTVELRGGTVSGERSGSAVLSGGAGRIAWHVDALKREADDYEIPGFAESAALRQAEGEEGEGHEQAFGVLPNSGIESEGGALGVSWVADAGFLGISANGLDTLYGIPGGHHHHEGEEGEEEEAAVRVDMEQRRWNLRGGVTRPFGIFRGASLRFGSTDYEHRELEGEETGTVFTNESWEGRVELLQRQVGALSGSFGVQAMSRDFAAIGEEAFVPPTQTDTRAAFAFQELTRGEWRYQLGARYEAQDVAAEGGGDRSFSGVSGSLGAVWQPGGDYSIGLSLARSTKLPNAEELFSNGPHLATNAFEIGDPDLRKETSLGADLTLRKTSGSFTGEVTLFTNRFDDFIYEQATAEEEDGLPVFRYVQRDARFHGAELDGVFQLVHGEPHHLDLELGADFVRAQLQGGEPLPRIPPERFRLGLHYRNDRLDAQVEGIRVGEQDQVAAFETPTEGYTLLNATLGYRFFTERAAFDVLLRGTNLTDEEARNHVSFLKDVVPMPGRDFSVAVRTTF